MGVLDNTQSRRNNSSLADTKSLSRSGHLRSNKHKSTTAATTTRTLLSSASTSADSVTNNMALDVESDYRSTLSELTENQKPLINMLTMLAEENDQSGHGAVVVRVIEEHIRQVPPQQKLPALFLVDSILKNCPGTQYRELFAKNIIQIFVHIFQEGDEKIRYNLHKVRRTWTNDIFPHSRLYGIDIKCNAIDSNWPVQSVSRPGAVSASVATAAGQAQTQGTAVPHAVHINPKFIQGGDGKNASVPQVTEAPPTGPSRDPRTKPVSVVTVPPSSATSRDPRLQSRVQSVVQKPDKPQHSSGFANKDVDLRSAKISPHHQKDRQPATAPTAAKSDSKTKASSSDMSISDGDAQPADASRKADHHKQHGRKGFLDRYRGDHDKRGNGNNGKKSRSTSDTDNTDSVRKSPKDRVAKSQSPDQAASPTANVMLKSEPQPESPDIRLVDSPQRTSSDEKNLPPKKRRKESVEAANGAQHGTEKSPVFDGDGAAATKKPRRDQRYFHQDFNVNKPQQQQQQRSPVGPRSSGIEPTMQPGSHAFDMPPTSAAMAIRNAGPLLARPPTTAPFPYADQPMFRPRGSGLAPPPPPQNMPPRPDMPPMAPAPSAPAPPPAPPAPLSTDIPANNRIFVDGRMYEVHFVDGNIPVIEREGLPYKIFFSSTPRDVVIDGVAYKLAFGESRTVMIDGQAHAIKFGAPSRELYMGGFAFRGAFGGPPIFATINGQRHTIRLGGPPPDVQVEPEPSYDLKRFMPGQQMTGRPHDYQPPSQPQPMPQPVAPLLPVAAAGTGLLGPAPGMTIPSMMPMAAPQFVPTTAAATVPQTSVPSAVSNVDHILTKLLGAGGIKLPSTTTAASAGTESSVRSPARPATPPIPSGHRVEDDVPREFHPPPSLKDFSMRALKVRYQAAIDALYPTKERCATCGLRFDTLGGQKYTRHLDWHFRENRRIQDMTRGQSRPWYLVPEDWVNYSEQGESPASKAKSSVFEADKADDDASRDAADQPVIEAPEGQHCCAVCGEQFEQFWDEEQETWNLRNAIAVGDETEKKIYHPGCFGDTSAMVDAAILMSETDATPFLSHSLKGLSNDDNSGRLPGLDVRADEPISVFESVRKAPMKTEANVLNQAAGQDLNMPAAASYGDTDEGHGGRFSAGGDTMIKQETGVNQEHELAPDVTSKADGVIKQEPDVDDDPTPPAPRSPGTPVRDEEPM